MGEVRIDGEIPVVLILVATHLCHGLEETLMGPSFIKIICIGASRCGKTLIPLVSLGHFHQLYHILSLSIPKRSQKSTSRVKPQI